MKQMKRLPIFIILLLFVVKGLSQESEEEYYEEEETQDEGEVQEEEEGQSNYFDYYQYFEFTNDEYANLLDKVNEMDPDQEAMLNTFVVEVQQDRVLKRRLFNEMVTKPKKKSRYKGKDSPGFVCIIKGLMENKTVYDAIIKDGRSEQQARNAATLAERSIRRKCGITKKVNKEEQ
ncbi:hypothetical protein [uncultured Aquimarina sp.]|uniref:hypothetical protein n=1 Tax=uncultured Aquimarina sp. TaxID=575652 RepID=UPI00261C228E|nr:hypothetical protein [uncultured Aquimarina sp.]